MRIWMGSKRSSKAACTSDVWNLGHPVFSRNIPWKSSATTTRTHKTTEMSFTKHRQTYPYINCKLKVKTWRIYVSSFHGNHSCFLESPAIVTTWTKCPRQAFDSFERKSGLLLGDWQIDTQGVTHVPAKSKILICIWAWWVVKWNKRRPKWPVKYT